MKRSDLEHVIRAAGSIADVTKLVIIGSQSILGKYPRPPASLTVSNEADLYPPTHPERSDLIDAVIGRDSSWFWRNFKRSPIFWQWPAALALQWWRRRPDKNCVTKAKIRGRQRFRRLYALLSAILGPSTILETQPNPGSWI